MLRQDSVNLPVIRKVKTKKLKEDLSTFEFYLDCGN